MKSRRDFLKEAATGAVLLGSKNAMGLANTLEAHPRAGKSKIVLARDSALHGTSAQPDEQRVIESA